VLAGVRSLTVATTTRELADWLICWVCRRARQLLPENIALCSADSFVDVVGELAVATVAIKRIEERTANA
jgi:hypothetical protein